jgi:colicin import membrane protein
MAAATQPRRPRHRWHAPEKGSGPAFALSLLAHTLLFIAIAFVVRWKSEPVGTVSAELWSLPPPAAVQQPPTPVKVEPPPPVKIEPPPPEPPRKADIVEQKKEPPKIEPKKEPPPKKDEPKKEPPKKEEPKEDKAKIAEAKAAAQLEANRKAAAQAQLDRMLAQAGTAPAASGTGSGRSDKYIAQIVSCIRPHIIFNVPDSIAPRQYVAKFEVMLLPTGEQTGAPRLIKASGLAAYDQAVERAIRRCDPFPPPKEGTMPRSVSLEFDPVETR